MEEGLPNTSSEFADEGTAAHFLGAYCLENNQDPSDFIGDYIYLLVDSEGFYYESFTKFSDEKPLNEFEVDEDMAEHVGTYVNYVRDVLASSNGTLFPEVSVPLEHLTGEKDAEGTSDVVILTDDEIIVIDLKYGMGNEVSAVDNPQLMMYASGAISNFAPMLGMSFKAVRMAISQPRITKLPSEHVITIEELQAFEEQVRQSVTKTDFAPAASTCKWCKAKATCPALSAKVQEDIAADFDDLLIGPALEVPEDTDELAKKMACLDLIDMWSKAIRSAVESKLLAGIPIAGWKVVQGKKGNRAWTNANDVEAEMKKMRMTKDEMYSLKLITPAAAEKAMKGTPKRWERINTFISQSEGNPTVVPESDKREALNLTPSADDFDDVEVSEKE